MSKVCEIQEYFEKEVPSALQQSYDNIGLLVGQQNNEVSKILLTLDITEDVILEAASWGAQMILSHHPIAFQFQSVNDTTPTGRKIMALLHHEIAALCLHTNLDAVSGGVNAALLAALGVQHEKLLEQEGIDHQGRPYGAGAIGTLDTPMDFYDFLPHVKKALSANGLRYHYAGRPVHKLAVMGGSGGEYYRHALDAGCDTFVSSDIKYHQFLDAAELGMNIIDADHFCTENIVLPVLERYIQKGFPQIKVRISQVHAQTVQFF